MVEQQSVAHAESKTERVALFPSHVEGRACASVAVMRIPTGVASGVALPSQGCNFGTERLASAPCGHLIVTFAIDFVVVALLGWKCSSYVSCCVLSRVRAQR